MLLRLNPSQLTAGLSMICECCGIEAATKQVKFYQNIGAIVVRFHKSIAGNLCKSCINQYFWKFTLTNFALGWWGTVSFLITPFLILNNIIRYLGTLGLSRVPDGAVAPTLTEAEVRRIDPSGLRGTPTRPLLAVGGEGDSR